jgi:dTDP-4-amino-4,6-dideoxygalactose transaminase
MKQIPFYKGNLGNFINDSLKDVMASGMVTNYGKYYEQLKEELEEYLNPCKVTLVASGTHALTLSLLALKNKGIIPKHAKILVPSFTFIASVQAILLARMEPVFADIYKGDWTLDIESVDEEDFDAVMPVNIFGVQPEIDKSLITIPDLSHAFGGTLDGQKNGTQGTICAFSTSVTKPFHTVEGGIVASENEELIKEVSSMSRWCLTKDYDCIGLGQWSKLSELHALVGLESLNVFDSYIEYKTTLANEYKKNLKDLPIEFQVILEECRSTYKDFAILVPASMRPKILEALEANQIGYKLYFSPAVHQTTYFRNTYFGVHLPVTESVSSRVICLPVHQDISIENVEFICSIIRGVFNG